MTKRELKTTVVYRIVFSALMLVASAASAADPVLLEGADVKISVTDIDAETFGVPLANKRNTLARPEAVSQIASSLYARRMLARDAERAGLEKSPEVQAALVLARERVLAEARLLQMDKDNRLADAALDSLALANYNAMPKRFEIPEQARARHILIRISTPDAKKKAEDLLAQLRAGADFAKLASTSSEDQGSAPNGGDLGYFGAGRMVKPFEEAVSALKKAGDLSDVVETQFGYHIIKLEDRRPAGVAPFAEVKEALRNELQTKTLTDARNKEIQRVIATGKPNQAAIEALAKSQQRATP